MSLLKSNTSIPVDLFALPTAWVGSTDASFSIVNIVSSNHSLRMLTFQRTPDGTNNTVYTIAANGPLINALTLNQKPYNSLFTGFSNSVVTYEGCMAFIGTEHTSGIDSIFLQHSCFQPTYHPNLNWLSVIGSPNSIYNQGTGIISQTNSLYVCGNSGPKAWFAKIATHNGNLLWQKTSPGKCSALAFLSPSEFLAGGDNILTRFYTNGTLQQQYHFPSRTMIQSIGVNHHWVALTTEKPSFASSIVLWHRQTQAFTEIKLQGSFFSRDRLLPISLNGFLLSGTIDQAPTLIFISSETNSSVHVFNPSALSRLQTQTKLGNSVVFSCIDTQGFKCLVRADPSALDMAMAGTNTSIPATSVRIKPQLKPQASIQPGQLHANITDAMPIPTALTKNYYQHPPIPSTTPSPSVTASHTSTAMVTTSYTPTAKITSSSTPTVSASKSPTHTASPSPTAQHTALIFWPHQTATASASSTASTSAKSILTLNNTNLNESPAYITIGMIGGFALILLIVAAIYCSPKCRNTPGQHRRNPDEFGVHNPIGTF